MRRMQMAATTWMALAAAASAQALSESPAAERIRTLFAMDEASFQREIDRRFQYPPPQPLPPVVEDERAGQALDAAYFQAFPDFDRSYSPAARARAKEMVAQLVAEARSLSHEQFVLRIAEIAALADNAHTAIGENALRKNSPRVPFRTFLFADGLYVLRAPPAHAELLGARIEAIDGRTIDEVYRGLARYLPGPERRRRLQLIPALESPALLHAAGLARDPSALTLNLRLADGRLVQRRVAGEERGPAAPVMNTIRLLFPGTEGDQLASYLSSPPAALVYLQNRTRLFSLSELPLGGLYIGLTHNDDGDEEPLAQFLDSALSRAQSDRPRFVVLDMRMNGGGDYTTSYAFARALPAAAAGRPIYVLTSPWTFSAAITTVAALKDAGGEQVRIVGELVGDRLDFWAEGGTFDLPNSAIQVHYAAGRHNYAGSCTDRQTCFWLNDLYPVRVDNLRPDVAAPLTFDSYRELRDPAIDAVLKLESGRGERG